MSGASGDVVIENCIIDKVCYTFNSDAGSKDYTVTIKNTVLNGWTSYSNVHKSVDFIDCRFGQGTGAYRYAFLRAYNDTTFTNCNFEAGYEVEIVDGAVATFENCTINGVPLTAENLATLVTTSSIANATVK